MEDDQDHGVAVVLAGSGYRKRGYRGVVSTSLSNTEKLERIDLRAAPLVRVKAKFTVKNAVCPSLPFAAYGVFDCEFGFPSHEWSCSDTAA